MARKKRATKRRTSRRRMSGVGAMGSQVTSAIYTIAGAVAAGAVAKFLPATMNDKLKAAVPVNTKTPPPIIAPIPSNIN